MKSLLPPAPSSYSWNNLFLPSTLRLRETRYGNIPVMGRIKGILGETVEAACTVPPATMEISWTGSVIAVRAVLPEPDFRRALAEHRSWWLRDRLEIAVALRSTSRMLQLVLFPSGETLVNKVEILYNHSPADQHRLITPVEFPLHVSSSYDATSSCIEMSLRLDADKAAEALDEEPAPFIRANVMRYRSVGGEEISFWQRPGPGGFLDGRGLGFWWKNMPEFVLEGIGWEPWAWGENRLFVLLGNPSDTPVRGVFASSWNDGETASKTFEIPPRDTFRLSSSFFLDPLEILGGEWSLRAGEAILRFPVGWKRGFLGRFRCGIPASSAAASPSTNPFMAEVERILPKLPKPVRTSRNILKIDNGPEIRLDRPGATGQMARLIAERFSSREDRLKAAVLLVNDPEVFTSSAYLERFSRPGEILAAGGGMCRAASVLLADVVSRLPGEEPACLLHVESPGEASGLPSHYFTGARRNGSVIPLDSELGRFFLSPDGSLASLEDLVSHPELAETSGKGLSEWFRGEAAASITLREGPSGW